MVAQTTSAPFTAASNDSAAANGTPVAAVSSSARAAAFPASRPATRPSRKLATRGSIRPCERACTPVPTMASTEASGRASSRADRAEPAAVRMAVTYVPSMTASGSPVIGSNAAIIAWWLGMPRSWLCGNTDTSFVVSAPAPGR